MQFGTRQDVVGFEDCPLDGYVDRLFNHHQQTADIDEFPLRVAADRPCSKDADAPPRQRANGGWRVRKAERLRGEDLARSRADQALDKGGMFRYCGCGRKYQLLAFDTPCPSCADHLLAQPVTFDPETDR